MHLQPTIMQTILLVEDDPEITRLISLHFNEAAYQLTCCNTGTQALKAIASEMFDLIILDISLPDGNGIDICKTLRTTDAGTPVMMLTCHADESDKVLALELGADDYITKPFGIFELKARVKAMMRRSQQGVSNLPEQKEINHADLVIESAKRKASLKGQRLDLTAKEFDLLLLMACNPGKTFSRKELLQQVWGFAFSGYEHTITAHINRLRLKLESDLGNPAYILTTWGAGYRFAE